MSTQTKLELSQIKMKFIERIVAEHSRDTLCAWYDMYEEAQYVASMGSDEEYLKEYRANIEESLKKGIYGNREDK